MPWLRAVKAYRKMVPSTAQLRPAQAGPVSNRIVYLTPTQLDELATAYRHGASVYDFAERFQVNRRNVSKRLKQLGVEVSSGRLYEPDVSWVQELHAQGLGTTEIARTIGRSELLVERTLRHSVRSQPIFVALLT